MLTWIENFNPLELCEWSLEEFHTLYPGPVVFHIPGTKSPAVFLSTLLHGDEWTGFHAIQRYFKQQNRDHLPRETFLLFGNSLAAVKNKRFTEEQSDMNRIWGVDAWTVDLVKKMLEQKIFACVDIHNNTGRSPHYSIISKHENTHYNLATLFSPNVIYLETPDTALSIHMSKSAPSITLECGLSDQTHGIEHTVNFLDGLYRLDHIPVKAPAEHDLNLYETLAVMKVPENATLSNEHESITSDIIIPTSIVNLNFVECEAGTILASSPTKTPFNLESCHQEARDTEGLLSLIGTDIVTNDCLVPCMLTEKKDAIIKDCFGYLMRRVNRQS